VESLIQHLQTTILALETLSDSPATASSQIEELLDQLFQQKIDLMNASLNTASVPFQQAAQAMSLAAAKAERAVKDPSRVGEMAAAVADAIGKLARLLDNVVPIE
jgi:methyl-accepting chemotaxis protein